MFGLKKLNSILADNGIDKNDVKQLLSDFHKIAEFIDRLDIDADIKIKSAPKVTIYKPSVSGMFTHAK